jgi:RND family efflux transporter MFP subunit
MKTAGNSVALATFLLLLPGFAGCGGKTDSSKPDSSRLPTAVVRIQTVEKIPRARIENVIGTVRSRRRAILEAKLSGRIDRLPVVLGQRVAAGDLMVRVDAAEMKARLAQAEATFEQAERDWARVSALFEQQAITRAEYDSAQSRQRLVRGALEEARAMMSYVEITAPFDAVVTRKWADVGDLAAPGKPLLSVEDPSTLQVEADVPQSIAPFLQQEARIAVRVEGVSGELTGIVREIAPTADPASRTVRVNVDLAPQPGLSSGQFARLRVPVGEDASLRVPASAVVERGQLEMVFTVSNQRTHLHLVRTGERADDGVEILSGLRAGEGVVVEGAELLSDGQPVEAK